MDTSCAEKAEAVFRMGLINHRQGNTDTAATFYTESLEKNERAIKAATSSERLASLLIAQGCYYGHRSILRRQLLDPRGKQTLKFLLEERSGYV